MLLVHHLLEDGGGIDARDVVVLEGGHERHGTRGDDEVVGIDVGDLLGLDILDGDAAALEEVPHRGVEEYAVVVVTGKGLGDIETSHAAELLLLLEEEELVGLHVELAADAGVAVDHQVVDAEGVELPAAGKTCGTCADDGDLCLVDLHFAGLLGESVGHILLVELTDFADVVDWRDTDAANLAVDEHFAGAALADAALEAAWFAVDGVAVDGEACLMEGCGDGVASQTLHGLAVEQKFDNLRPGDVENRMSFDSVHHICFMDYFITSLTSDSMYWSLTFSISLLS